MTDEHWPPRLVVREYRWDYPHRMVWFRVEGFRDMDLGIDEGDPLYILRELDVDRISQDLSDLRRENRILREKVKEYEEYFRLQKKLQEEEE